MRLIALDVSWEKLPDEVKPFVSPTQTLITPEKEYSAYAVSVYSKVVFVLVIDDSNTPVFLPVRLFRAISVEISGNWICNLIGNLDLEMILGPEFLAKDLNAYNGMVDQDSDQVERFWLWLRSNRGGTC